MKLKMKALDLKISLLKGWADNMNNLLKLEFRKVRRQKSFYICVIIMAGLLLLSILTENALTDINAEFNIQHTSSNINTALNALSNSSFFIIAGIFTALLVCDDYEQQTIKNIYTRGYSRTQVYLAKLISVWACTTVMFIIVLLCSIIFGTIYFGMGELGNLNFITVIAVQYIVSMANIGMCFFVSALLRKTGSSIAASIVVPMIVNMLLGMLDSFIKLKNFTASSLWISSFMSDLSNLTVSCERLTVCIILSLVYIVIFTFAGISLHKRIEL